MLPSTSMSILSVKAGAREVLLPTVCQYLPSPPEERTSLGRRNEFTERFHDFSTIQAVGVVRLLKPCRLVIEATQVTPPFATSPLTRPVTLLPHHAVRQRSRIGSSAMSGDATTRNSVPWRRVNMGEAGDCRRSLIDRSVSVGHLHFTLARLLTNMKVRLSLGKVRPRLGEWLAGYWQVEKRRSQKPGFTVL